MRYLPHLLAVALIVGAVGYVWALRSDNARLRADAVVANALLRGCAAQNLNIQNDRKSDAEIDNTNDIRGLAADWMRLDSSGRTD